MNLFDLPHSLKNIPIASEMQYQKSLVGKVEKFITNMRWKLFHVLNPGTTQCQNYGFNTTKSPPQLKELIGFEEDLFKMVKEIKFRQVHNNFQRDLRKCVSEIRNSNDIITKADKTRNLYTIPVNDYRKLLKDNITSEYKKANHIQVDEVNKEASKITKTLNIDDRIDTYIESNAFITLKDHKPEFISRRPCRLINPAKSNLGRISKKIIESIVKDIKSKTKSNQWKNSNEVIDWFKQLENKESLVFIKFDISSFYPSITEKLFDETINWS